MRKPPWLFLAIILTATFAAGVFDVVFPDVVPNRPYSAVFNTTSDLLGRQSIANSSVTYDVIVVVLLIVLVASLIRSVANQTTGIVIGHSGFTPNQNLTGSPGTSSVIQLYPLMLAFLGLALAWKYWQRSPSGAGSGI